MITTMIHGEDSPWMLMELDWSNLVKNISAKVYTKGHVFYEQNEVAENVFVVDKGRVALGILNNDGSSRTIITLDEGCIFGNLSLFDDRANSCRAFVVSDTISVFVLPKSLVLERIENDSTLMHNMLLESNRTNRILIKQLELMHCRNAESIVCFFIVHLVNQYSEIYNFQDGCYKCITMRFTHQDIADVTGLSRVSVSNILSSLIKERILEKRDKKYVILNQEALEQKIKI